MESHNTLLSLPSLESSSTSVSKSSANGSSGYSEVEVKLASQNPKKRSGRRKFKETRHPVYRGVRSKNSGKWVCEVRHPVTQSRVWLGTHPTAEMAARAHDVAVLAMRAPSAFLNFADSVWRLPVPESNNVKDIQKAAAKAAEAFRPSELVMESEEKKEVPETECYVDEEEMFEMPGFLDSMAEALMVPPPQMEGYDHFIDNVDFSDDMSLWSF